MAPLEALAAYSRKEVSEQDVMRALVSYDDWLAVMSYAVHATGQTTVNGILILSSDTNIPAGELWFYTDENHAMTAVNKGAHLGTYARGVPGTKLFAALPTNFKSISVNRGCEASETWFIDNEAFALSALWAHAVALEKRLAEPDSPEKFAAMRDYPGYLYLTHPGQDAIVTGPGLGGMTNPALVFTAVDCAQKLKAAHPQLEQHWTDGKRLFAGLPSQGVDGVVFNALGPGTKAAFDLSICERCAAVS